jgi:SAM-dependent methyltransferase
VSSQPIPTLKTAALPGRTRRASRRRVVRCQICGAATEPGLDLGHQPVGDCILAEGELNLPETSYPMRLHHCPDCGLTQLGYIVNPRVVYKRFPFVSGTTRTATEHLQSLPTYLIELLGLGRDSFAVDIGSNDGTLLKAYLPAGVPFLGIDPSGDPVAIANEQGLKTLHAFFNEESAGYIEDSYGRADVITACGVFAHIADLAGVMKGVQRLLAPEGVFASDNQSWFDMVERGHYDNIFHQHLRYYAMQPLSRLFEQYGLEIFDVERSDIYGGSLRVFACRTGAFPISERAKELAALEQRAGLYEPATNARFEAQVRERRVALFDNVVERRRRGQRIIGIGAPAKASTVANYCRLGPELIEYITEVNPLRIDMYLPGMHIPIVEEERMFDPAEQADAGILFAWNYYDEIVPKLRSRGFEGDVITP